MRPVALSLVLLVLLAPVSGAQVYCDPREGQLVAAAEYVFACAPPNPVSVRLFDKNGRFVQRVEIKPGLAAANPKFYPEELFVAALSGCVQGDAILHGANEVCIGRFNLGCASTAPFDVALEAKSGVAVKVDRTLNVFSTRATRPRACVEGMPAMRVAGSIASIIDGESLVVTVTRDGTPGLEYRFEVRPPALREGRAIGPSMDAIMKAGKTAGQTGGPISQTEAEIEAAKVRFRRK